MAKKVIKFRVEGNRNIGHGHLVRCITLANYLKIEFKVRFYITIVSMEVNDIFKTNNIDFKLIHNEADYLNDLKKGDISILDGYNFSETFQKDILRKLVKLICIDDIFSIHYYAHLVINYTPNIFVSNYNTEKYTKLLLGPKYVILRPLFLLKANDKYQNNSLYEVLISLGGADKNNYTIKILEELLNISYINRINIMIGGSYQFENELKEINKKNKKIFVHRNISEIEVVNLMLKCRTAICSASTVCLEYSCIGGNLFVVQTAENQKYIFKYFIDSGLARRYTSESFSLGINLDLINKQKQIFDGKSLQRIKIEIINLINDYN